MPFWYWLVLAAVLGVLEVAVPAMVCIWFAAAAAGAAVFAWLAPTLSWEHQALIFAALAVAGVVLGRLAFVPARRPRTQSRLNRRADSYVGRSFTLDKAIVDGRGRLKIDDTVWLVAGPDLPAGTRVRVAGTDAAMLVVEPL